MGRAFLHLSNHLPIARLPSCICADPLQRRGFVCLGASRSPGQEQGSLSALRSFHLSALLRQYPVCAADFGIFLLIFQKFPLREPAEL